jgi:hypothetical protein
MKEFVRSKKRKSSALNSSTYSVQNPYLREVRRLRKTVPNWDTLFSGDDDQECRNAWVRLDVLGGPLCDKYAWAIPNKRALNIIANFSPNVEVGAGKGYWASLLQAIGVDVLCFDKKDNQPGCWTEVQKGGPTVLKEKACRKRTLFLCYPDDSNGLAMKCLECFTGDIIIHVGELVTTGTLSGGVQAPFGRTTGSDFSIALAESFHCLLTASLPRFPFSKDCITVRKRTVFAPGKSHILGDDEANEDGSEAGDDDDCWAAIPPEERMPEDRAAPCLEHLLR